MKYIHKSSPPKVFSKYCSKKGATFDDLSTNHIDIKEILRETLLKEQGYICCYCGCRIGKGNSVIEHIQPRKTHPEKQLDYYNIVCSCEGGQHKRSNVPDYPLHCDAQKGNLEIEISPLMSEWDEAFIFDEDGNIFASNDDERTKHTIKVLGLDNAKVTHMREAAIEAYKWLDEEDKDFWEKEYQSVIQANEEGFYESFAQVIQQYIQYYKLENYV